MHGFDVNPETSLLEEALLAFYVGSTALCDPGWWATAVAYRARRRMKPARIMMRRRDALKYSASCLVAAAASLELARDSS